MEERVFIESKFRLGEIVSTTHLFEHCEKNNFALLPYLVRHAQGDWGDVCQEDKDANDQALKTGERLLSAYTLPDGEKILDNHRVGQKRYHYAFSRRLLKVPKCHVEIF